MFYLDVMEIYKSSAQCFCISPNNIIDDGLWQYHECQFEYKVQSWLASWVYRMH